MTPEDEAMIARLKSKSPEEITFCELADLNILIHRQQDEIKQAKKEAWIAWNDAQEQKDL